MSQTAPTNTTLFPRDWRVRVGISTQNALDVSNLDIEFKILRTIKKEPNKCALSIWNLNQDHRAALAKRNNPSGNGKTLVGIPVEVIAGYRNQTSTIFRGDLRQVGSSREDLDWKTVLAGDDGGRAYREARFDGGGLSFTKGTSIGQILARCADALEIGQGNINDFITSAQIPTIGQTLSHPMVLRGSVSKALDRVVQSIGLAWSIQNGALQLQEKGQPLKHPAIYLSPSTGLIGSPESSIDASISLGNPQQFAASAAPKVKKIKPHDTSILKLKTLIIPGMIPGRKIVLDTQLFPKKGYVLTEVEYVGQTWGQEWYCNCVARAYAAGS